MNRHTIYRYLTWSLLLLLSLAACSDDQSAAEPTAVTIQGPAFVLFYSDP